MVVLFIILLFRKGGKIEYLHKYLEARHNSLILYITFHVFSQRLKDEKALEIYLVLTPEYEGSPFDKSLEVYDEIAEVFFISEVNTDTLITVVEKFEEGNCI